MWSDIDVYYNYIQPYSRHNSDPTEGINVYSFGFYPEQLQPSGSANLSRLDDIFIEAVLKSEIAEAVLNDNIRFRFGIYGFSYNILRIMSGLAGLAFFES